LRDRLPARIAEIHIYRALLATTRWHTQGFRLDDISIAESSLAPLPPDIQNLYPVKTMRATIRFVRRDVEGAIAILESCKKEDDSLWMLNLSFLYAYREDLRKAIRLYRAAIQRPYEAKSIRQIEQFMLWVMRSEPSKKQFLYCLGFLVRHALHDRRSAIKYLREFIDSKPEARFPKEAELAKKWMSQLLREKH
jgi:tetratricopeptide (TPR) repeat protein